MKRVAVLAHYDVDSIMSSYVEAVVSQLLNVCDRIVVVSTSGIINSVNVLSDSRISLITRDNIGYDFISYKVGIESIHDLISYDQLIVLNDSFYTLPNFNIQLVLEESIKFDIYGLTFSNQIKRHLQSYFVCFNKPALVSKWFSLFWKNIYPYKRKLKIVYDYEVGLNTTAEKAGLTVGAFWEPSHSKNPCHHDAVQLSNTLGLIKVDAIRNKLIKEHSFFESKFDFISEHVFRTKEFYENRILSAGKNAKDVSSSSHFFEISVGKDIPAQCAVVVHVYYIDLIVPIKKAISHIPENVDVFVSVSDESHLGIIYDELSSICNQLHVTVIENRGRDVRPFIEILKAFDFSKYKVALKLHTKKSKYSSLGDIWREELYKGLLPSSQAISKVIRQFKIGDAGIAADSKTYLSSNLYWGANKSRYDMLCDKLNITDRELLFIGGTMFWFKPSLIYPLVNIIELDDFENELNQQDGTLAHVIERLFCVQVNNAGGKCIDVLEPTKNISSKDVVDNRVMVLHG